MPIDERTAARIAKLGRDLPIQSRLLELAMLAGNGLAGPLARVRMNQARREAVRARRRFGAKSPEFARKLSEVDRAEQLTVSIDSEIARLSLDPPIPSEDEVAVYGYVRDNGKPARGLKVALSEPYGDYKASGKTAADGSFSLIGAGPGPLSLLVGKGSTILSADRDPWYTSAPRPYYRVVDLSSDAPERPEQAPPPVALLERPERDEQPDRGPYDGLTLNQALVKLGEEDRQLSRVVLATSRGDHGHVIGATMDSRSGAVTIHLAAGEGNSDRLDALAVLMSHHSNAEDLGLKSIEQAGEYLKAAKLESLEDAMSLLDLSDDSIARKAKVRRGIEARIFRRILTDALGKLETS